MLAISAPRLLAAACAARRPSLTADRRLAPGKAGQDGGMVYSIKQRDGRITGVRPPNRQPEPTRISKEADMFQHDMPTVAEFGSDDEIERQVRESKIEDHFSNGEFEGINYTIVRE